MMRSLLRIQVLIGKWTRALASVGFVALLLLAVLTTVDVLMRWFAGATIRGLMDINQLVFIIGVASCLPLVVAEKGNISIRFLGESIHPRVAAWLDVFAAAALLLFVALIGWELVMYVIELFQSGRTTWQLRIQVAPYWTVATVLVLLCIPVQLTAFLIDLLHAITGVAPPQQQAAAPGIEPEAV
jgi:TRAP-type transport system small permease protein